MSEGSLKDLHACIKKAINGDKETPNGQDKPYGVIEYPDWKSHSKQIESAMKEKNIKFDPIDWNSVLGNNEV